MKKIGVSFVLMFGLWACSNSSDEIEAFSITTPSEEVELEYPPGFPEIVIPDDNPLTEAKIALGERLFFDPILSSDKSISCASCHIPEYAFSDTVQFSRGFHGRTGKRNSPSLMNIAYQHSFFRDGGAPTLEIQLLTPIQDTNEMNLNINDAVERLNQDSAYLKLFTDVFGEPPSLFGLSRAIAAYERTLLSGNAPFDNYLNTNNESLLTAQELEGWQLFSSDRLKCAHCHSGFNFTNNSFTDNGLYANYTDLGRADLTLDSTDRGKFRVPSLRNVAITGPYMHDGSLATLEEVIDHYSHGGMNSPNQDSLITGFELTILEREALIAFLNTLTDSAYQLPFNQ